MDIGKLLFNPNGRIAQQQYWIGVLIIIGGNFIANFIPLLGFIISLGLIYVGVAVYGKRLHDAGRTAWLHAVPWAINIALLVVGFMIFGGAIISAIFAADAGDDVGAAASAIGGGIGFFAVMAAGLLVWIGYTIWVGTLPGEPGPNRFGPVPGSEPAMAGPGPQPGPSSSAGPPAA